MRYLRFVLKKILHFLGELVATLLRATVEGIASLLKRAAPWIAFAALFYGLWHFAPDLLEEILTVGLVLGLMVLGFRKLFEAAGLTKKRTSGRN